MQISKAKATLPQIYNRYRQINKAGSSRSPCFKMHNHLSLVTSGNKVARTKLHRLKDFRMERNCHYKPTRIMPTTKGITPQGDHLVPSQVPNDFEPCLEAYKNVTFETSYFKTTNTDQVMND